MVEYVHCRPKQDLAGDSSQSGIMTPAQNPVRSSHMEAVMEIRTNLMTRQRAWQLVVSNRSALTIDIFQLYNYFICINFLFNCKFTPMNLGLDF